MFHGINISIFVMMYVKQESNIVFVKLQMDQMRAGNTRDSLELEHSKSENKRVSDSLNNLKSQLAELERNVSGGREGSGDGNCCHISGNESLLSV